MRGIVVLLDDNDWRRICIRCMIGLLEWEYRMEVVNEICVTGSQPSFGESKMTHFLE